MTGRPRQVGMRGFTLVELLVVIGIIALLVAVLMPSLNKARRSAQQVACLSNMRSIGLAFLTFAADNKGHLPACQGALGPRTEAYKGDWLGNAYDASGNPINNDNPAYFATIPQGGTIYAYIGKSGKVLRCPATPEGDYGMGNGSNGKFDYQMFQLLSGAKVARLKPQARPFWSQGTPPGTGHPRTYLVSTPMLLEPETGGDPFGVVVNSRGSNSSNGKTSNVQNNAVLSQVHPKGASLVAIDGSAYWYHREAKSGFPNITAQSFEVVNTSSRPQSTNAPALWGTHVKMSISQNGWNGYP